MSSESVLQLILDFSECNRINNLQRVDAPLSGASKSRFTEGGRVRMVHRRRLDESELNAVKLMLELNYSYRDMAKEMGVCTDTLKRILVREGLAEFEGAKYACKPEHKNFSQTWKRPCLKCKDDSPRPKGQFICSECKRANEVYQGASDAWLSWGE